MLTITGCNGTTENGDKEEAEVSTDEYINMANEINTQIGNNNDFEQLKFEFDNLKGNMTDKVYDNSFDLSVSYTASTFLIEGYEKVGYEVIETIVNQTQDEEGKVIVNVYVAYSMSLRAPEGVIESGSDVFEVGKLNKFVFSNGKLTDFQIVL